MFEELAIGFLLGLLSMLQVFPGKQTFWQWSWQRIHNKKEEPDKQSKNG